MGDCLLAGKQLTVSLRNQPSLPIKQTHSHTDTELYVFVHSYNLRFGITRQMTPQSKDSVQMKLSRNQIYLQSACLYFIYGFVVHAVITEDWSGWVAKINARPILIQNAIQPNKTAVVLWNI